MCKWNKYGDTRIDPCMKEILEHIHGNVVACCCGHGKYPMTIVKMMGLETSPYFLEIVSGKIIPRTRRFYKKNEQGVYYIPEVLNSEEEICECGHAKWDEHKSSFYNYKGLKMMAQECNVKGCKCKKFAKAKKGVYYIPEVKNG